MPKSCEGGRWWPLTPEQLKLPNPQLRVLCAIGLRSNRDGWAWPSHAMIREDTGLADGTCRQAIRDLERDGWIRRERRSRGDGSAASNVYYCSPERQGYGAGSPPPPGAGSPPMKESNYEGESPSSTSYSQDSAAPSRKRDHVFDRLALLLDYREGQAISTQHRSELNSARKVLIENWAVRLVNEGRYHDVTQARAAIGAATRDEVDREFDRQMTRLRREFEDVTMTPHAVAKWWWREVVRA